jgi:hypothetical protein
MAGSLKRDVALQDLLEPDAAHAVRNLLPEDVGGDLSALCVWPDQVRHWYKYTWSGPLHFIDTPDKACTFDYASKFSQAVQFDGADWPSCLSVSFVMKCNGMVSGEQGTATAPMAPRTCASPAPSPTSRPSCSTTSTAAPTGSVSRAGCLVVYLNQWFCIFTCSNHFLIAMQTT